MIRQFVLFLCVGEALGSFVQLAEMIYCATGENALTEVDCYGCWCGPGGGGKPVDSVDECCMKHDHCYDESVVNQNCSYMVMETYSVPYGWHCEKADNMGDPVCDDSSWFSELECGRAMCHCDRDLAMCLSTATFSSPKPAPKLPNCPDRTCITV